MNKIIIYETQNKDIQLEVQLVNETVWLSQKQMATLFDKDVKTISEHILNIYNEKELDDSATIRKFQIVQKEGSREVTRNIDCYNLDVIISVGYRVHSVRGTQFRIWATKTLKDFLVKGYALNEKRLAEVQNKFKELQTTVTFMESKAMRPLLTGQEGELLHLLSSYAKTLTLLEAYDRGKVLDTRGNTPGFGLTYEKCIHVIFELKRELTAKKEASDLFGNERGKSFEGIVKNIYQTYDGVELYPNIEDKAANLLYLTIKDHPFSDGNKRIAAFLFIYFLDKTESLYKENGEKRINDNALTALALLVAESNPKEKNILISIVKSLIAN